MHGRERGYAKRGPPGPRWPAQTAGGIVARRANPPLQSTVVNILATTPGNDIRIIIDLAGVGVVQLLGELSLQLAEQARWPRLS